LLALMLYKQDLSVVALIGIILLMGIVKKNAIMMIDFALEAERKQGMSPRESIVQASLLRFRPIMMTTLAALFGAIPLAFEAAPARSCAIRSASPSSAAAAQPAAHALYDPVIYLAMEALKTRFSRPAPLQTELDLPDSPSLRNGRRSDGMSCASFSEPFIRRPVGTTLLAVGPAAGGAVAYRFLPVASMPTVEFPTINVSASRPGADPETMAATVAAPLERRLGEIAGVTELTSRSSLGSTRITVQFDLNRSIDGAARDVQAAINAAQSDLPADLPSRPSFRKSNPAATPIMILALTSKTVPPSALYDAADTVIAQRLSQIDGVAEVSVNGAEQPAIRVRVNPIALASMGLSMEDVRSAIANTNASARSAVFDRPAARHHHRTNRQLRTVPTTTDRGAQRQRHGGAAVAVASIEEGVRNSRSAGWFNGQPSVLLVINKQANSNVIETSTHLRAAARAQALDPGRHRHLGALRPHQYHPRQRVRHAAHAARHCRLVMLVVFVFLRRAAGDDRAGVTVPLSLAGTCAMMWVAGFSIDNLSLMALAVSVGFVVDDAIVMIENCFRNLEKGMTPFRAAIEGAQQIGFTVLAISISLVAGLHPAAVHERRGRRVFREFSVTLAFAIAVSTAVSLTLTPMICAHFVRKPPSPTPPGWTGRSSVSGRDGARYARASPSCSTTARSRCWSWPRPWRSPPCCMCAPRRAISRRTTPA
jgi:multidrug efflux pump